MVDLIKAKIIEVLKRNGDMTLTGFMAMPDFLELAGGQKESFVNTKEGKDSNILLLAEINSDCIKAFNELKFDNIISFEPTSRVAAVADGNFYDLPIATDHKFYKEAHWLPTLVKKGVNFLH
jgi:hypothetical protein